MSYGSSAIKGVTRQVTVTKDTPKIAGTNSRSLPLLVLIVFTLHDIYLPLLRRFQPCYHANISIVYHVVPSVSRRLLVQKRAKASLA